MAGDWLLGIEIGGTKLQLGLGPVEGGLQALRRLRIEPLLGAQGILDQIRGAFRSLLGGLSLTPEQVRGVGVGFGGPVDVVGGRVQTSYQVPGWTGFPLADWLRQNLGVQVVAIQNDADTAGLAEARLGAGVGYSPLLYLTIGSGIGGALIIAGRIYRGAGLGALEIGHLDVIDRSSPAPQIKRLEEIASGWGIARGARQVALDLVRYGRNDWVVFQKAQGNADQITAEMVAQAAAEGDHWAATILDRARQALAFALRQAIVLVAPRRIIVGGGVSLIGETYWLEPLRKLVDAEVFPPFRGSYDIVAASLGEKVVIHGALSLARDATQTAR
jgi:glucokinase